MGPYRANTSSEPLNSVRGPSDGRYEFAFIEFGDQGSARDLRPFQIASPCLFDDLSTRAAAIKPLLLRYV